KSKNMLRDAEDLPHAISFFDKIFDDIGGRKPLLILDYDGTLSPIVPDPDQALLSGEMKDVLVRLATLIPVAVISGRDRADVENKVALDQLIYAGSHGLDMAGPEGLDIPEKVSEEILASLKTVADNLSDKLKAVKGCMVESKKYAIAVHFRNVAEAEEDKVKNAVLEELGLHDNLKKGTGKKILELKPAIDWHKGRAVNWLFEALNFNRENAIPIFIGDDITDEDAFVSIQGEGIGILVGTHGEQTAATFALTDTDEVLTFLEKFYSKLQQHG
ncbi:MAG TPA: trehalose-phosphatase, partial [Cyclobacteriaceae bacterium]|nr:trehalose-phosphatase [Cyclobacteriaceae bacterium]